MQKGKPPIKDLPVLKMISQKIFIDMILVFYCRTHKISSGCDMVLRYLRNLRCL